MTLSLKFVLEWWAAYYRDHPPKTYRLPNCHRSVWCASFAGHGLLGAVCAVAAVALLVPVALRERRRNRFDGPMRRLFSNGSHARYQRQTHSARAYARKVLG